MQRKRRRRRSTRDAASSRSSWRVSLDMESSGEVRSEVRSEGISHSPWEELSLSFSLSEDDGGLAVSSLLFWGVTSRLVEEGSVVVVVVVAVVCSLCSRVVRGILEGLDDRLLIMGDSSSICDDDGVVNAAGIVGFSSSAGFDTGRRSWSRRNHIVNVECS